MPFEEEDEVEYCVICDTELRTFIHSCDGSSVSDEIFGCPRCDDVCAFCSLD